MWKKLHQHFQQKLCLPIHHSIFLESEVTDPAEQKTTLYLKQFQKMSELMQIHFNDITATYIDMLLKLFNLSISVHINRQAYRFWLNIWTLFRTIWINSKMAQIRYSRRTKEPTKQALVLSNTSLLMLDSVHNLIEDKK